MSRSRWPRKALGLAWALAALLLSACARPTPTPEPVIVRFAHPDLDEAYYRELALQFQKAHPGVTVELKPKSWQALSALGPGDADVLVTQEAGLRQARGELLSLDPWLIQDEAFQRADYYPGTLELFAREGKTWAIPAWIDPRVMYYNKDLFDRRHVPYPQAGWTWEDFLATTLALRDRETKTYGYVFDPQGSDCYWFVYQHGGRLLDDYRNPTRPTFDDPLTADALQWCADLVHVHQVAPTPKEAHEVFGGDSRYSVYVGVYSGQVGLWTGVLSGQGGRDWPRQWEFRWGLTTLPRDAQATTFLDVAALAIAAKAQHPEACWQWLSFVSRQLPSRCMPARRSLAESGAFEQLVGPDAAAVARASAEGGMMTDLSAQSQALAPGFQALQKAIDAIIAGDASAQEALTRAQHEAEP